MKPSIRRRQQDPDEAGFTLIELLIVVVILGILAAITVFAVEGVKSSSAQSACKTDWKTVESATQAYDVQTGGYPQNVGQLAEPSSAPDGTPVGPWINKTDLTDTGGTYTLVNPGHYQIETANGTVQVYPAGGGNPIGNTGTVADCDKVT